MAKTKTEFQGGWGGGKRAPRCCPVHTQLKTRQRSTVLFSSGNYAPNRGSVVVGKGLLGTPRNPETSACRLSCDCTGFVLLSLSLHLHVGCGVLLRVTAVPGSVEHCGGAWITVPGGGWSTVPGSLEH